MADIGKPLERVRVVPLVSPVTDDPKEEKRLPQKAVPAPVKEPAHVD